MAKDESGTLAAMKAVRREIVDPALHSHGGRVFKTTGDGVLAEFSSVVAAVECAAAIQRGMAERDARSVAPPRLQLRIGINVGDVIVESDAAGVEDVFGDGVNVAARLQELAEPGGIALSGDPVQEYFADGITEDLITALSAWRWFPVIARNSTFTFKGRAVDLTEVGKTLGARYVVEGSVQRAGDRVRISTQLLDASSGVHLCAHSYDRRLGDVFDLRDEITRAIVAAIEPQLTRAEQQRASRKRPENLDSWDLCLQALAHIRTSTPSSLTTATALLDRAIAMDPQASHAQSLLALARFQGALAGWTADPAASLASTHAAAEAAVAPDDGDWLAHALLGIATLWNRRDYEKAALEEEAAVALNPSAAIAYHFLGCVLTFDSRPAAAIAKLDAVLKLDPRFPFLPATLADLGLAHLLVGNLDAALRFCERSIAERRENVRGWQRLAATLGHLGRVDEAAQALAQVQRLQKDFGTAYVEATYPFRDPAHTTAFTDGLRKAGWEG